MKQYFVNYLMGFLIVVAICPATYTREISFFEALSEEVENNDPDTYVSPINVPDNSLTMNDQPMNYMVEPVKKKRVLKKYLNVNLQAPRGDLTIEEGKSYELTCIVSSNPQAFVKWIHGKHSPKTIHEILNTEDLLNLSYLNQTTVTQTVMKYMIDCASKRDEGVINCAAMTADNVEYQSTNIVVEKRNGNKLCLPNRKPVITTFTTAIFSKMGSKVILPCIVVSPSKTKTIWYDSEKNMIDNRKDDRYEILPNVGLLISNLSWDDMDIYTCLVESEFGEDYVQTFLYPVAHDKKEKANMI